MTWCDRFLQKKDSPLGYLVIHYEPVLGLYHLIHINDYTIFGHLFLV